jgi:type I restriction enzyme S subunit
MDYEQQLDHLEQSILAKAFRGGLVPQDPSDEPASALLERIRAQRKQALPKKSILDSFIGSLTV